jgi:hypothetical protein
MTAACGFTANRSCNSYCNNNSIMLIEDFYQKSLEYCEVKPAQLNYTITTPVPINWR